MEFLTLHNGKKIEYEYYLVRDGMRVFVLAPCTKEEQKEFTKELKAERDVATITFQ